LVGVVKLGLSHLSVSQKQKQKGLKRIYTHPVMCQSHLITLVVAWFVGGGWLVGSVKVSLMCHT
jgi:hypothetical protein